MRRGTRRPGRCDAVSDGWHSTPDGGREYTIDGVPLMGFGPVGGVKLFGDSIGEVRPLPADLYFDGPAKALQPKEPK
jgi:hypothetical protein